jgi:tetratricopeptide (TPR) repeat protein
MSLFSVVLLGAALFFAYQIYLHVSRLEDPVSPTTGHHHVEEVDEDSLIEDADRAYEKGEYPKAVALLHEARAKNSNNTEVLNKLGFVLAKEQRYDEALEAYEQSLQQDANDDTLHNAMASVYRTQKRYDEAQKHYERALEIDAEYAITYFNYANLLVDMGENDKARSMYAKAIELDPNFTQAKFELEKMG